MSGPGQITCASCPAGHGAYDARAVLPAGGVAGRSTLACRALGGLPAPVVEQPAARAEHARARVDPAVRAAEVTSGPYVEKMNLP